MSQPDKKKIVAAFDFDGTLSRGSSGSAMRFCCYFLGPWNYAWFIARRFFAHLGFVLRHRDEINLNHINHGLFAGRNAAAVQAAAEEYCRTIIPHNLLPVGMERLRAHLANGDRCILVSRGYALFLRPWAHSVGINEVLASNLEVDAQGRLTGRMLEPSCDSEHKRTRLLELLPDRSECDLYVYGDGRGDFAMFAEADYAFIRKGSRFLRWGATATTAGAETRSREDKLVSTARTL